jgi:hypothetical protein
MTTAGIKYATKEADDAVALATAIGKGSWRLGMVQEAELSALDSEMRPIDRLGANGLGALTHLVQPHQDAIDRLTGKAAAVRTIVDAWHRAAKELDEATTNFDRTLRTDTDEWAGEAAGTWRTRAREYLQAMRGSAGAARATAAAATEIGETVAGMRTEAARLVGDVVDAIVNLAKASSSVQGATTDLLARAETLAATLTPQLTRLETNLLNMTANFRESQPVETMWKRMGVWFGALPRNMVQQTPPTDAQRGDFGRGGAYLDGSHIRLVPRDPTVPNVTLPNNVGAQGFELGPRWNVLSKEHHYRIPTDTDIPFDQARAHFGKAISENPVPANPADGEFDGRPEGVTNDAGMGNLVRTYTLPSPDPSRYTDITVNYTLGDKHILQEGYVIRYGERMPDGNTRIISYGEGTGLIQHPLNLPAHAVFGYNWEQNHEEIVGTVKHRMNMPPR